LKEKRSWWRDWNSIHKIPHTCTSWSDCMTWFLHWIRFLALQNMLCKYASYPSIYLKLHRKALLGIGKKRAINILVRKHIYIEWFECLFEEQSCFDLENLWKTPSYLAERVEFCLTILYRLEIVLMNEFGEDSTEGSNFKAW
jgi:hypothetical protein